MSRAKEDRLRSCPTCATPLAETTHLGLRDYQWINDKLPGKVGFMDGDAILERRGNVLMLETKPDGGYIPLGQKITLKALVRMGIHVWCVWEKKDGKVEVGAMDRRGEVPFVETMSMVKFVRKITDWYQAADQGEL